MRRSDFTPEQIAACIYKCKTDLFFLCKDILGKNEMTSRTHGPICNKFVKKDPSFDSFMSFAQSYERAHDRMILIPRKCFKSTIKVVDNIQWFLTFPNISILTFTATNKLSSEFVGEFKNYLTIKGGEREDNVVVGGDPTFFQQLFPEYCITEKENTSGDFTYKFRTVFTKEPTVGAMSVEQSGSGYACDILDLDDVLSEDNTQNPNQLDKLDGRIAQADNLKKPYGFRHIIGTRYDPMDAYGRIAESHGITDLYGDFERDDLIYECKPCWWLKGTHFKQPDYKLGAPPQESMDLFFPEQQTYKILCKKLKEKPEVFFSQQLNDPITNAGVEFTEDLIRASFVDHTQLPHSGTVYAAWDLAYSMKTSADQTAGAIGLQDDRGEWWILEVVHGRFDTFELPFQIVNAIQKFQIKRTIIEETNWAKLMVQELDRWGKKLSVDMNVEFVSLGKGVLNAKLERMKTMYTPLRNKTLHFLNTITCCDELVKQFRNIGNDRASNDIPDAISRLTVTFSSYVSKPVDNTNEIEDRQFHDMIFGRGKYEPLPPVMPAHDQDYIIDSITGLPSPYRI